MLKNILSPNGIYSENARMIQHQEFYEYSLLYKYYKKKILDNQIIRSNKVI